MNTKGSSKRSLQAAPMYQKALIESGHDHKLVYEEPSDNTVNKKRCRKRNVTWWNAIWSDTIATNVGKEFLHVLDTAFPGPFKEGSICIHPITVCLCLGSSRQRRSPHNQLGNY